MWQSKAEEIVARYNEFTVLLSDPKVVQDIDRYRQLAKSISEIEETAKKYQEYQCFQKELEEDKNLLKNEQDQDLRQMLEEDIVHLEKTLFELEEEIKYLLLPRDPNDDRNTLMEIRAGTGGEEAALFVSDLFRMYSSQPGRFFMVFHNPRFC